MTNHTRAEIIVLKILENLTDRKEFKYLLEEIEYSDKETYKELITDLISIKK